jgi:hypothetical protein
MKTTHFLLTALIISVLVTVGAGLALSEAPGSGGGLNGIIEDLGGDVTGPASVTDNQLCRFDGTGGKTLQACTAVCDDSGNLAAANANGWELLNEAASATNPTLAPNQTDDDTGIGWRSAGRLSIDAEGVEVLRVSNRSASGLGSECSINGVAKTSGSNNDAELYITGTLNDTGAAGGSDVYSAISVDITTTDVTGWNETNLMRLREDSTDRFRVDMEGDVFQNDLQVAGTAGYDAEYDNGTLGSGTVDIDWNNGNNQKATLDENVTLTFTNPPDICHLTLRLIQDAGAGNTVTFPSINWAGGTAPTVTATANAVDVISLYYYGSSNYVGSALQDVSTP